MDAKTFEELLSRNEGDGLDFKQIQYDFAGADKEETSKKRSLFLKDMISMWNTPRTSPSYIVCGVEKHLDGTFDLKGVSHHIDDATLIDKFSDCIFPTPRFAYEALTYKGLHFGVFIFTSEPTLGPCLPTKDLGEGRLLRAHQVYVRRNSKNVEADWAEQQNVFRWFNSPTPVPAMPTTGDGEWDAFFDSVHGFSPQYHYLCVAAPMRLDATIPADNIGRIDWSFCIDCDPESATAGLLSRCILQLEPRRKVHSIVKGNRPTLNLNRGTYWYYARGLFGLESTTAPERWKLWRQTYDGDLRAQLSTFARTAAPKPVVLVALWKADSPLGYDFLDSILDAATSTIGSNLTIAIVTDEKTAEASRIAHRFDANIFSIPIHQLCHGLSVLQHTGAQDSSQVLLPSSSGAPIQVDPKRLAWLSEEIELVHLNIGTRAPEHRTAGLDFLRGHQVSWYDLGLQYDVEREVTDKIAKSLRTALSEHSTRRVNLYHSPGAGGTTIGRRLLWDFRKEYPCFLLHKIAADETADRISYLAAETRKPLLVAVDGASVSDKSVEELFERLSARHLAVVVLQILRRFSLPPASRRYSHTLPGPLTDIEAERFVHFLTRESPSRTNEIAKAVASGKTYERTPFYLGLVAFDRQFVGIDKFVRDRLEGLTAVQKRIVAYFSIAHLYGQQSLSVQAFADVLSLPHTQAVDLALALPSQAQELLVPSENSEWRTSHPLVAEACLEQILGQPGEDVRLWKHHLSTWAKDFANFCRGQLPEPHDVGLELARRVFVFRDNSVLLGSESAGISRFSQLMDDIPTNEGKLEVLRHLTAVFPDEPHFWAHLGRLFSLVLGDSDKAVAAIEQGISLEPEDPVLHHMKGMALRVKTYQLISDRAPIEQVVAAAEQSARSFTDSRRYKEDEAHSYISETQLIIRVLDYAAALAKKPAIEVAAASHRLPWLRDAAQVAEDLLDGARRARHSESPSEYEQRCRADLSTLYGDHAAALQTWDKILTSKDVYLPPVRRQIVWTYLDRRDGNWQDLPLKETDRIVDLLEKNLQEEPSDDRNLRLWIQAIRKSGRPISLDRVIERVAYWKARSNAVDSNYYLYVLYALQSLTGLSLARASSERALEECRAMTRSRRNRTKSFEWLGDGSELGQLIHQSWLGEWDRSIDFWSDSSPLKRIHGVIRQIRGPEAGTIELTGGMGAFFVPGKGMQVKGYSENQAVTCLIGFSYEGIRAWSVSTG